MRIREAQNFVRALNI